MTACSFKIATLSALLMAPFSVSAMAQNAPAPTPVPPAPSGVGGWISGHPLTDFLVVLAIIVVIAGTYFMRQRSRA